MQLIAGTLNSLRLERCEVSKVASADGLQVGKPHYTGRFRDEVGLVVSIRCHVESEVSELVNCNLSYRVGKCPIVRGAYVR
jgi:hypothetical protein